MSYQHFVILMFKDICEQFLQDNHGRHPIDVKHVSKEPLLVLGEADDELYEDKNRTYKTLDTAALTIKDICERLRIIVQDFDKRYPNRIKFILKENVLEWIFAESNFIDSLTQESERAWGKTVAERDTNQWTTFLGEALLHELLLILGKNPREIHNKQRG